jgi:hypothetical protein
LLHGNVVASIAIPTSKATLQRCLDAELYEGLIDGFTCVNCGAVGKTEKQSTLTPGKVAMICLKRFTNTGRKLTKRVDC